MAAGSRGDKEAADAGSLEGDSDVFPGLDLDAIAHKKLHVLYQKTCLTHLAGRVVSQV
jgi:hypothetical protein